MFKLNANELNNRLFYLKSNYSTEETFDYSLKVFNHITKTGFTIDIQDQSDWVSGKTNVSELSFQDSVEFYSGFSYNINSFDNLSFVFNNIIQISGTNHLFYEDSNIQYQKAVQIGAKYAIVFNDITNDKGMVVIMNSGGTQIASETFCDNPVSHLSIISLNAVSFVVGYYDLIEEKSYLKEIFYDTSLIQYNPTMFYDGECNYLNITKIDSDEFIITYHSEFEGIIRKVKKSIDHIFSVGFPFVFNDGVTLFSDSQYQNNNVVVLYYDLENQLKVKNCRLYDDYIGIGLPFLIKEDYCYDLNIGILDDNYCYITYYDGNDIKVYTSLLKIDNDDIIVIKNAIPIDDWSEGMSLNTISDSQYMISYMNSGFTGVYRYVDMDRTNVVNINVDYNEFNIDLSHIDVENNSGYNDYWIYYNGDVVEKGIVYIHYNDIYYNI